MHKMKQIICGVLICCMVAGLCACGAGDEERVSSAEKSGELAKAETNPVFRAVPPKAEGKYWLDDEIKCFNGEAYIIGNRDHTQYILKYSPAMEEPEKFYSFGENLYPVDIAVSPDGTVYALAAPADEIGNYSILTLSSSGEPLQSYEIKGSENSENCLYKSIEYANNKLYILSDINLSALLPDSELSLEYEIPVENNAVMSVMKDGSLAVGQSKNDKFKLEILNDKARKLENKADFDIQFVRLNSGLSYDVYLGDTRDLYGYNFSEDKLEKLYSWEKLGIICGAVCEYETGKLMSTAKLYSDRPSPVMCFEQGTDEGNGSAIILATFSAFTDPLLMETVQQWNFANPDFPIQVRNYSAQNAGEDARAAEMQLAADIAAGSTPDIYDFSLNMNDTPPSSANYARKGLLENLYPYIDSDPELTRVDFLTGLLSGLEINGGLYELTSDINFLTTFAAKSIVGENENWTYDNFNSIIEQDEFFESIFDPTYTRDDLLETILFASGDKLIDWSKGESYFTSDYFINVLEVLKSVPTDIPEDAVVAGNMASMIKNSHSLLFHCVADSPWRVSSVASPQVFGEDYCFPGFPEIGSAIVPKKSLGISSSSKNKDKCWEFLREFILEKNSDSHRMPPRTKAIEQLAKNEWQQAVNGGYSQNHPYVQNAMEDFIETMKNSETIYRYDSNVLDIVKSETGAYFAGDKSAEQVAENIQSRVSIYLAEQG